MPITVPPQAETENDRDLERRVRELETLIREARRRARRRRVAYAAVIVVVASGLAASFGRGGGTGTSLGSPVTEASPRSSAAPLAAALAPPLCSSAGSATVLTGWLSGHLLESVQAPVAAAGRGHAVYTRWCGPATIVAHLQGTTYRIRGGRCVTSPGYLVRAGLLAQTAARGAWVGVHVHATHPGTYVLGQTATYASAELAGRNDQRISRGAVTIGQSRRNGTFALRLPDGTPLTGSWTCG